MSEESHQASMIFNQIFPPVRFFEGIFWKIVCFVIAFDDWVENR